MGLCGSTPGPNPDEIDLTHFEVMKVVGKGGFGKVNAVTKKDTKELMAIKRIEKFAVLQSQSHLNMVWVERKIMALQNSPFLCNLLYAFESPTELYLVMPFMQGGDLRYYLRTHGQMKEEDARFYAAEMALGMADIHSKNVVYRDLKPENVLLDENGHVCISDFGLGHFLRREESYKTYGQAGTRGYQAPEVVSDEWYGTEADVWSYGVTVYELIHGQRPWRDNPRDDDTVPQEDIQRMRELHISSKLSPECASFLHGVLTYEASKRLGCGETGWEEVKKHPWFKGIDWDKLYAKEIQPPFQPDTTHANCSPEADLADQLLDRKPRPIQPDQQKHFQGWNFNTSLKKDAPNTEPQNGNGHENIDVTIEEKQPE